MRRHPRLSLTSRAVCFAATLLTAAVLLPSCAYMQTHKNVEEAARSYKGYKLDKPQQLFRSGKLWYVAATPAEYRLRHDIVHDNVFRKTNEPHMQLLQLCGTEPVFHPISTPTAMVLLRTDGYAENSTIAREISESPSLWLSSLPHASVHEVKAQVVGEEFTAITQEPTPVELPMSTRVLSALDLFFVDVPGTLAYNVAVPFFAPFVFFHEFLSE